MRSIESIQTPQQVESLRQYNVYGDDKETFLRLNGEIGSLEARLRSVETDAQKAMRLLGPDGYENVHRPIIEKLKDQIAQKVVEATSLPSVIYAPVSVSPSYFESLPKSAHGPAVTESEINSLTDDGNGEAAGTGYWDRFPSLPVSPKTIFVMSATFASIGLAPALEKHLGGAQETIPPCDLPSSVQPDDLVIKSLEGVNIRAGASTSTAVIGHLDQGEYAVATPAAKDEDPRWARVKLLFKGCVPIDGYVFVQFAPAINTIGGLGLKTESVAVANDSQAPTNTPDGMTPEPVPAENPPKEPGKVITEPAKNMMDIGPNLTPTANPEFFNSQIVITEAPRKITVTPPNGGEPVTFEAIDLEVRAPGGGTVVRPPGFKKGGPDSSMLGAEYEPTGYLLDGGKIETFQLKDDISVQIFSVDVVIPRKEGKPSFRFRAGYPVYKTGIPEVDGIAWSGDGRSGGNKSVDFFKNLKQGMGTTLLLQTFPTEDAINSVFHGEKKCDADIICSQWRSFSPFFSPSQELADAYQSDALYSDKRFYFKVIVANI